MRFRLGAKVTAFLGFGGGDLFLHPIRGSILRAGVFVVPVSFGAIFVFGWPLAAGIAFSIGFALLAVGVIFFAARLTARRVMSAIGDPADDASTVFVLENCAPAQAWSIVALAMFAMIGAATQVPGLVTAIADRSPAAIAEQGVWLVAYLLLWSVGCGVRARRLARDLHGWFDSGAPGVLRGAAREGRRWTPATLAFDGGGGSVLAIASGGAASDQHVMMCGPGPGWRIGRQDVVVTVEGREVLFTPLRSTDPAQWLHFARAPRWLRGAPSPMWELVKQLRSGDT